MFNKEGLRIHEMQTDDCGGRTFPLPIREVHLFLQRQSEDEVPKELRQYRLGARMLILRGATVGDAREEVECDDRLNALRLFEGRVIDPQMTSPSP